jgi:transcriptional regulator with XRE-family HTH domain
MMCEMATIDYENLGKELIALLRGQRSQTAFSKRLGYRSNVVSAWEAGRAWPTAARFFQVVERSGRKLAPLARFFRRASGPAASERLKSAAGVAALLDELRGATSTVDLARGAERSRFAVARWLHGEAEPRLPDFLRLLEAASLRLLDFLACFVDPSRLSSVAAAWRTLEAARRVAYELPWSHAVLRAIELESYRRLKRHRPGFIADVLQISLQEEARCVALLLETGQLERQGQRLVPGASLMVDTRGDPERARGIKAWWSRLALERLEADAPGSFAYNLFSVSRADLERIRELHRAYFREVRRIVAASEPSECVALMNVHLFELGRPPVTQ